MTWSYTFIVQSNTLYRTSYLCLFVVLKIHLQYAHAFFLFVCCFLKIVSEIFAIFLRTVFIEGVRKLEFLKRTINLQQENSTQSL